jgi:Spy/CpxP family protein refolding chaperone
MFGNLIAQDSTEASPAPQTHEWHHHGAMFWHELNQLNLTDAQKQQVKQIMQSNRQNMRSIEKDMLTARKDVATAMFTNPNDEAALRTKAAAISNAITAQIMNHAQLLSQISKILTPDQQQKLNQLQQERLTHMQQMIDRLSRPTES